MKKILANLSVRQRITIVAMAILVGGGLYALVQHHHEADFRPLFTGLAAEDAAGIVQKLKETGVDYRLPEGGGSVLVPSARLADLRLSMAALGLPKSGRIGFELFDKVNLGATEFTEHINYRRALEGELERTVMALAEVDQARVHLTFPKDSVFLESQQPAKASVVVRLKPGAHLSPQNVVAINHLVASAVEGLAPDAVSVLDMNGNLLSHPKPAGTIDGPEASEAGLEYRHKIETDLLAKINGTLEPLLGANRFKANVSVDCDFSGGEQSEEIFDPARSVMVSSQRTEDSTGVASASGTPGTASSLPRPTSRPGGSTGKLSRMTENITYQSSRTVKKTRMPAGALRKMSLAVLVDQEVKWEKDKAGFQRVLVPPTPEKLKIIHDLVAGVTGFTADRGDQLVIETLPFENTLLLEPPPMLVTNTPASKKPQQFGLPFPMDRKIMMIGGGVLAALVVGAVVFVLLRRKKKAKAKAADVTGPVELPAPGQTDGVVTQGNLDSALESQLAERDALQKKMDAQALASLKLSPVITKKAEVFAKHLREMIASEPDTAARVLRSWIREEEQ